MSHVDQKKITMTNAFRALGVAALTMASVAVAAPAVVQAAPVPSDVVGTWKGTVRWADGSSRAATSTVTSAERFVAEIEVPGVCTATWLETTRSGSQIQVRVSGAQSLGQKGTAAKKCFPGNLINVSFPSAKSITANVVVPAGNTARFTKVAD